MKNLTPVLLGLALALSARAADVNHWRGAQQNGAFDETNLPETWTKEGKNLVWSAPYGCRSAPLVMNGRVFMINRVGDGESLQERVVALDLQSGKLLWEHKFNAFMTDIVASRIGWANLAGDPETGNVYAHGVQGLFFCFNPDGKIVWQRSLTEEFGRISGYGGRTNTPIVEGDLVLISSLFSGWGAHGKPVHRMLAMDKKNGEIRYWADPSGKPLDTTYSVPVIANIGTERVLFMGLADGTIVAMNPYTGAKKWPYTLSKRGISSSVIYNDGKVYAAHSEENFDTTKMGKVVCLDAKTGEEIWVEAGLACGYASPVLHDGLLYVPENSGNLHCLDAKTGHTYWDFNYGNEAKGSPAYADGKIYVGDVPTGHHILKVSKEGCTRLSEVSYEDEKGRPIEIYSTPVISDGKVLLTTRETIYCIANGTTTEAPKQKMYSPPSHNQEDAVFQLVPAETVVVPGESVNFLIVAGIKTGRRTPTLDPESAEWSMKGLQGKLEKGTFTPTGDRMQGGTITVTTGDLTATARVRVIPPLPYKEDFESLPAGAPPPGWITSKLKSQVVEHEGGKVLKKLADRPAPPFARMRNYMRPRINAPYTVQADLFGMAKKKRFIPDMGLINSRYLLIMVGTTERTRKLRLVTYAAIPRLQKDIEFAWTPDTWYTAKFSVEEKDGKALVRGKVWPKGENEPKAWTIETTDSYPNLEGSPGLYAYSVAITSKSNGTEVLFDNVEITPNN